MENVLRSQDPLAGNTGSNAERMTEGVCNRIRLLITKMYGNSLT